MGNNFEIERKFLIEYPDTRQLETHDGSSVCEIVQTYLTAPEGEERRVRQRKEKGKVTYFKTLKKQISDVKRIEEEYEITAKEYEKLLEQADTQKRPIEKTRYSLSYPKKVLEIDIYPFWSDKAIVEVELEDEDEEIDFPDFLKVIKEVTNDRNYKNSELAKGNER